MLGLLHHNGTKPHKKKKKTLHGGLTLTPEEVQSAEKGLFCEKKKSWPGHRPPVPYKAAFLLDQHVEARTTLQLQAAKLVSRGEKDTGVAGKEAIYRLPSPEQTVKAALLAGGRINGRHSTDA